MRMENLMRKTMSPKTQKSKLRLTIVRPRLLQTWLKMKRRRKCHTRPRTGSGAHSGDCVFQNEICKILDLLYLDRCKKNKSVTQCSYAVDQCMSLRDCLFKGWLDVMYIFKRNLCKWKISKHFSHTCILDFPRFILSAVFSVL